MFTIETKAFRDALAQFAKIVSKRNTIPILSNIRAHADGDSLVLVGTDLDCELTLTLAGSGFLHDATFPLYEALAFAKGAPADATLRLSIVDCGDFAGARLSIDCGAAGGCKLATLPADDFPTFTMGEPIASFVAPAADIAALIAAPAFAMSQEETRYYLNGVYLHPFAASADAAPFLRSVATDGHRLCRQDSAISVGADFPGIIVPRLAVNVFGLVFKAAGKARSEMRVDVYQNNVGCVAVFASPGKRLATKLIDGTFPDYERVIPKANPRRVAFNGADCAALAKRLSAVSADRTRSIKLTLNGAMAGYVNNPEFGTASGEIALQSHTFPPPAKEGDLPDFEMSIGFNGQYLQTAMAALDHAATVEMVLSDPGAPVAITAPSIPGRTLVLMPLRV